MFSHIEEKCIHSSYLCLTLQEKPHYSVRINISRGKKEREWNVYLAPEDLFLVKAWDGSG